MGARVRRASLALLLSLLAVGTAEARKDWCDYAAPHLEQLARGAWAEGLPSVLLHLIHPLASAPMVESVTAQCDRGVFGVDAFVRLRWRGGLLGREFHTTVSWSFDDNSSVVSIDGEKGAPSPSASAKQDVQLFFDMLLPVVRSGVPSTIALPSKREPR